MTNYFLIPGYNGSFGNHWQSYWEKSLPNAQIIVQDKWGYAEKDVWVKKVYDTIKNEDISNIILIGHSLGVATIIHLLNEYDIIPKGVLLVAPTDVDDLPEKIDAFGFSPMPLNKLNTKSIIINSTNDKWISIKRAEEYAQIWGSEFFNIGQLGHINADSDLKEWAEGCKILARLD